MPCYIPSLKRKLKEDIPIPPEEELRKELGALDHKDLHRIMERMTDEELTERVKKINKKREEARKKRKKILDNYQAQEAKHYH